MTEGTRPERIALPALLRAAGLFALVAALLFLAFLFMRDSRAPKALIAAIALIIGIGGVWGLFYAGNGVVEALPRRLREATRPWLFVGPAILILCIYIVFPAVRTIWISFFDRTSQVFVGFANYFFIITDPEMLLVLRNTLLWVLLVPFVSVVLGLLIAVLIDRLGPVVERVVKALIFLPMAISFVGASVIWRFVYYFQPAGYDQVGLLNAIVTAFGGEPQAWLTQIPWNAIGIPWINNLFLIFIMIWLQTGFAMVILSAAVKGVPQELLEAARIDGAGEVRVFFRITIPRIRATLLTVSTTILFLVLKVFDVVFVMTSGNFDTDVVASRMYAEAFRFFDFGRGSALAVLLFIIVVPFMMRTVRRMRRESA
ncbi:MAG: sugar ABC transporter permease [Spirochaetaceae bacterium]|nr:sugar ABC transporter permease [Spirochaetaceae bacterium]